MKPTALLYKDPSVRMHLYLEYPRGMLHGFSTRLQNRYVWLKLRGPGRVAIQSAYEHFEDPKEAITRFNGLQHAW